MSQEPPYQPTLEEIHQQTAAIRANWSPETHYQRAGEPLPGWLPPMTAASETDVDLEREP